MKATIYDTPMFLLLTSKTHTINAYTLVTQPHTIRTPYSRIPLFPRIPLSRTTTYRNRAPIDNPIVSYQHRQSMRRAFTPYFYHAPPTTVRYTALEHRTCSTNQTSGRREKQKGTQQKQRGNEMLLSYLPEYIYKNRKKEEKSHKRAGE